ncbi:hypothetical protein [Demequina litorisediminis]|uniref:hypothetical protein n=1 Tax=Demequina litorisediminis TaxID=1849022 RepID=UPI0024E09CFE|nr:hypothetical protein [Demequina litorisediminis]
MRASRIARSTAFFGIFALAVAGCSGDADDPAPETSASDTPVAEGSLHHVRGHGRHHRLRGRHQPR